jgi:hypothetical protein
VTATFSFEAHRRIAAGLAAIVLVLAALVTGAATARPARASSSEDAITGMLNHERAARGLPRLATRGALVKVARAQARRMAARNRLYHNPSLARDVKNFRWVGENVGYGPSVRSVHVAFMNSPAHKANILDTDYTQVGLGVVVRDGRVWIAEVFRQPLHRARHAYASFHHTLRYGSRGAAVKRVQARLGVRTTGWYGRSTKHAVSRFQKHLGWRGRGNVGPGTWKHLF